MQEMELVELHPLLVQLTELVAAHQKGSEATWLHTGAITGLSKLIELNGAYITNKTELLPSKRGNGLVSGCRIGGCNQSICRHC